jgi:hypothetical protein
MKKIFGINEKLLITDSVAIVGSGPSLKGKNLGSEIDSHDNVFRFNGALTTGFEHIAGAKTTHICIGLDLAYFSNYPFIPPTGNVITSDSNNRYQNALILKGLNPNANIISWSYEIERSRKNRQHENIIHLSKAFTSNKVFTWFKEKEAEEVKDNYQGNRILESLGLSSRLDSGKGMRTGFRTVLMIVKSGITPNLFGFDIDLTVQSAKHYYDSHISDNIDTHPAHDIIGEMAALIELSQAGIINVKG